jgi:hypothetical protein
MVMRRFRSVALAVAVVALGAGPAGAAATTTVANWQMNESAGATVMVDSSGNNLNGAIGSSIQLGVTYDGAKGYNWPFRSPTDPPAEPGRIVVVNHNDLLNPGSGDYAVTVRYRTKQHFGNIVQKGQAGSSTGYFKVENPQGRPLCKFRGLSSTGSWLSKVVQSPTVISDNKWHTVRCERTSSKLTMTLDGAVVATANGSSGTISNRRPISIAGKYVCDNVSVTCDYFTGHIDYIKIERG